MYIQTVKLAVRVWLFIINRYTYMHICMYIYTLLYICRFFLKDEVKVAQFWCMCAARVSVMRIYIYIYTNIYCIYIYICSTFFLQYAAGAFTSIHLSLYIYMYMYISNNVCCLHI